MSSKKTVACKSSSTESLKKKKSTPQPGLHPSDPFEAMEYSCIRSTKDIPHDIPKVGSAGNNPKTMARLGALVDAFQKQMDQENGEAGEPSGEAVKKDGEK